MPPISTPASRHVLVPESCIKKQINRMCRKLGVTGRTELALRLATEVFRMKER